MKQRVLSHFEKSQNGRFLWLSHAVVILIVISIVMWFVLHQIDLWPVPFAVGRNEEAARFSGINTRLVIASSICHSRAAHRNFWHPVRVLHQLRFAINPRNFYELYGIAAAVLGGCSLRGGEGSVIGILIGIALLQVLQNLVNLLGIPSSLNFAVMGAVVLIGVLADQLFKNRAQKKARTK